MHEQDDSMITSGSDATPSQEDHMCTNPDTCMAGQPPEHLIVQDSDASSVAQEPIKTLNARKIALLVVGAVVVLVGGLSAYVYTHASTDGTVRAITTRLPFPAMMVGRRIVTYKEYYNEQDSLKKYFASSASAESPAPTDDQLNDMIVQALTNKSVIKTLASNYGITSDPSKVEAFYQNFLQSNPGQTEEAVEQQLKDTFGWSIPEFKQRVVTPIVLSTSVEEFIAKSPHFQKPLSDEIQSAHTRVTTGGEDFEAVGTEVHERVKLTLKSDLGFIKKSDLPEAWADKVSLLENGQVSDVIDLPQGYAIFKVTDRIKSQEKPSGKTGGEETESDDQLHLYTITVPKKTAEQVIETYLQQVSVRILIKA